MTSKKSGFWLAAEGLDLTMQVWKEGSTYVAYAPGLGVSSCGRTVKEARSHLKEAVSLYLKEIASRKQFVGEFTRIISRNLAKLPAAEQDRCIRAALRKAVSVKPAKTS